MRFVDTNVLLYAVSTAPDEASKAGWLAAPPRRTAWRCPCRSSRSSYVQATRARRKDRLSQEQASLGGPCAQSRLGVEVENPFRR